MVLVATSKTTRLLVVRAPASTAIILCLSRVSACFVSCYDESTILAGQKTGEYESVRTIIYYVLYI